MLSICRSKPTFQGRLLTAITPPASARQETPRVPVPAAKPQGRVLVAEDELCQQQMLRFMLRKMNVEIDVAADGQAACEMAAYSQLAGRPYELILMDIRMPQLNGYEATRHLRQHGWQGPIVALTTCAMLGDREKSLNAGCDAHVTKPFAMAELQEILTRFIPASNRGES